MKTILSSGILSERSEIHWQKLGKKLTEKAAVIKVLTQNKKKRAI